VPPLKVLTSTYCRKTYYFTTTVSAQNQKLFVLLLERKTEFIWGLGTFVKEMLSGIYDELKLHSQNYTLHLKFVKGKRFKIKPQHG
jgi:hypothetical protein